MFYGGNMIKPEDRFHLFCGRIFTSYKLTTAKKYKIEKWRHGKDEFYAYMYNKNSLAKTTYYAELI